DRVRLLDGRRVLIFSWLLKLYLRRVATFRQLDANGIALAVRLVIFTQLVAEPRRLDAHDGIDGGVEGLGAIEHRQGDIVALEALGAGRQRFIDDRFPDTAL